MDILEKISNFLKKLQALPEGKKKTVFFGVVIPIALLSIAIWAIITFNSFKGIEADEVVAPFAPMINEISNGIQDGISTAGDGLKSIEENEQFQKELEQLIEEENNNTKENGG